MVSRFRKHGKLIRTCIANGIETNGCHPWANPYIDFVFGNNIEAEYKLISTALDTKNSMLLFSPDGGNPLSGDNWYKPVVLLGNKELLTEEEVKVFLDSLTDSFSKDREEKPVYKNLLSLMNSLLNKESRISVRVENIEKGYRISLEANFLNDDIVGYYRNFFEKTKFTRNSNYPDEINSFEFTSSDLDDLNEAILEITELFKTEFISPKSNTPEKGNMYVRNMRKTFGDTEEGQASFNQWFEEYKKAEHGKYSK